MSLHPGSESTLALLYNARFRFRSIEAKLRYQADAELVESAKARWIEGTSKQPLVALDPASQSPSSAPRQLDYRWNVWWSKPWFWRMDRINLSNQHIITHLIDQEKDVIYSSDEKSLFVKPAQKVNHSGRRTPLGSDEATTLMTGANQAVLGVGAPLGCARTTLMTGANQAAMEMAFLDPSFLLSSHELLQVEEATYSGRQVHRFRAYPRADREAAIDALFWSSADMYELLVDAELGILLAYTAYLNNHPFAKVVVDNVTINASIPDEVRDFTPPEGARVHKLPTED